MTATTSRIALFLPSLEGGGAERVFVQLANQFATRGHQVELVLAAAKGPYLNEVHANTTVIDLGADGVSHAVGRLARYLRESRPDVLLSGLDHANIVAIVACRKARSGTRCVVSVRSVPTEVYRQDKSLRRWLMLQSIRIAYRFADLVIANSSSVAADLSGALRLPKTNLRVIYNPLDIAQIVRLSREKIVHPWLLESAPPIILSVGSLAVLKDFPTLLRAFARIRPLIASRLVILGEGPDRIQLQLLTDKLGLKRDVSFPGFASNPFAWMRSSSVFVSSSLTEGCPNALMQALACGIPVISTDCPGGSAEILENGKWGVLVPVGDSEAMAGAILSALNDGDVADVRQRAQNFAMDNIVTDYLDALLPSTRQPAAGNC